MTIDLPFCLLTFWEHIQPFDSWLITHINQDWGNNFLDTVLPFVRETMFWIPPYLFLLLFVTSNFGIKGWWWSYGCCVMRRAERSYKQPAYKTQYFPYAPLSRRNNGTAIALFYKLLSAQLQLYLIACYQPFCPGHVLFRHFTAGNG